MLYWIGTILYPIWDILKTILQYWFFDSWVLLYDIHQVTVSLSIFNNIYTLFLKESVIFLEILLQKQTFSFWFYPLLKHSLTEIYFKIDEFYKLTNSSYFHEFQDKSVNYRHLNVVSYLRLQTFLYQFNRLEVSYLLSEGSDNLQKYFVIINVLRFMKQQ